MGALFLFYKKIYIFALKRITIMNYDITIDGEPTIVTEIRHKILETFKDLEFIEDGHKYFLNGEPYTSVSTIVHQFQRPFDEEVEAEKYAIKHGKTKDYWIDKWRCNAFKATTQGTRVHAYGESRGWWLNGHPELILDEIRPQYNSEKNWLIPIHPKEEAIDKFMNDLPSSYHLVLNEAKVYCGKNPNDKLNYRNKICGTFDMLFYYDGDGDESKAGLVLMDYKTNKDLYKEYSRSRGVMLAPPFNDLYDESLGVYTLQLNLYSSMLEDIGFKVLDRKIIWLKNDGSYEKISVENVTDRLRNVL